jgi:hypothetical protein
VFLLAGCGTDAKYFMNLKTIDHVKVEDIRSKTVGKIAYTEVVYEKNGKEYKKLFASSEDQGLRDYYESAQLFEKDIYLDLIIDKDGYIVVATLSEKK